MREENSQKKEMKKPSSEEPIKQQVLEKQESRKQKPLIEIEEDQEREKKEL